MIIVILATMAALLLCTIFSAQSMKELQSKALDTMETDEREAYDEQIKQQVDNVISLCQTIYDQYQAGVYTEAEARKLAADEIRQLRYGDSGYFWVDQYDGTNVVLLGSATEGTNRMETKDANGYQMVKEIIRMGQEPDGGYVDYVFPKEGETESSDDVHCIDTYRRCNRDRPSGFHYYQHRPAAQKMCGIHRRDGTGRFLKIYGR